MTNSKTVATNHSSAGHLLFGCAGIRGALETYARRFDVLELDLFAGRKAPTALRPATLRKWRREAGPTLAISLVAPAPLAAVKPTPQLEEALVQLLEAQRHLQARFLLLSTSTDVSPAPLPRERLATVISRIREGLGDAQKLVQIAWEPHGLWEPETAAAYAKQLDVMLSVNPLADVREPFWDRQLRYLRLGPVGGRLAFSPTRMRMVAELLAAATEDEASGPKNKSKHEDRVVVFTTPKAPSEAKRLRSLVGQLLSTDVERDASAGGGRLILPRGRAASALIGAGQEEEE